MEYILPVSGDQFIGTHDGKTRRVVRIDKRSGEISIVFVCEDCEFSNREYPVSERQWKKELGFGSWRKK